MQYRYLGQTGVRVSSLCFGAMTFGKEADEAASGELFRACREAGINFFDCADMYQAGRAEEILGRLIKDCRDGVVVTTKGFFPTGPDPNAQGASRYHLRNAVEASLRRLQTDRIDVYFIHRFDDRTPLEETLRVLDDLVRQGKILYPGVSNFAAWQVEKALGISARRGWAPPAVIQPMYNLLKRQAEAEILPMAEAEGLGVIPYSPMAGGLLSGKFGVGRRPASGRLTENKIYQTRYSEEANFEIADRLDAFARERGWSTAALALAWVAGHPAVTAPIFGARNVAQLRDALASLEIPLDASLRAEISALSPEPPPATDRSEERTDTHFFVRT
jgi:aryl-alcohol dehydrogenase-like predicted oxidoreductase